MASIAQVRQALSDAVDSIEGLRCRPYVPDNVSTPQAVIADDGVDYDLVLGRGADTYRYKIVVYVDRDAEIAAQKLLDTLREPVGSTSMKTVVEANAALAALVDYAQVKRASEIQAASTTDASQAEYLMIEFDVEIVY